MTHESALHKVFALFDTRGWRDAGGTALRIANLVESGRPRTRSEIAACLSPEFLARNDISRNAGSAAIASIDFAQAAPGQSGESSRTLLLLSADPIDQTALRIQTEQRMIRDEAERAPLRDQIHLELRPGLLRTDLARYLLETRPAVVHFSGHGDMDAIYAEDGAGRSSQISTEAVAGLFALPSVRQAVRLVVLSSCLSDSQASAIGQSIPAVIGMKGSLRDDTALAFGRGLYMALGQGLSVAEAFEFGRNAIALENIPEDHLPVLHSRPAGAALALRPFDA